jgi:transcription elongation factor GreA
MDMPTPVLTTEGYQKLQDELEYLRTTRREQIAQRLHEAIEGGELLDNAELEAAKNEQAFVEGSIKELEILLATARVVDEAEIDKETVQVGNRVTIQEIGATQKEEYVIVGAAEADPTLGKISNESPMGKALLGKRVGDKVQIEAPAGAYTVKVLKVDL